MQKYYLYNFKGYTISVAITNDNKDNEDMLKDKATILAQAEAIKKDLNYKNFTFKEITNIEYLVLTTHLRISDK